MAVRYRPRFPRFTSTPPRPTRPERLLWEATGRGLEGARQDSKRLHRPPAFHQEAGGGPRMARVGGQGRWPGPGLESCRAPHHPKAGSGSGALRNRGRRGKRKAIGGRGARQNSKPWGRSGQTKAPIQASPGYESHPIRFRDSEKSESEAIRGRIEMSRLESCRVRRKIHRQPGLSAGVLSREFWSFVARLAILYWSLVAQTIN
ncbi:hypothetical protein [Azospirillum endophyticum]